MANLFTRYPKWLFNFLGLDQPELPNVLETGTKTVVDIVQQGWGAAQYSFVAVTHPASTAATTIHLLFQDDDLTRLWWGETQFLGWGAGVTSDYELRNPVVGNAIVLARATWAVGDPTTVTHVQTFLTQQPVIIPPGQRFAILVPLTGVGESILARGVVWTSRSGVKPW